MRSPPRPPASDFNCQVIGCRNGFRRAASDSRRSRATDVPPSLCTLVASTSQKMRDESSFRRRPGTSVSTRTANHLTLAVDELGPAPLSHFLSVSCGGWLTSWPAETSAWLDSCDKTRTCGAAARSRVPPGVWRLAPRCYCVPRDASIRTLARVYRRGPRAETGVFVTVVTPTRCLTRPCLRPSGTWCLKPLRTGLRHGLVRQTSAGLPRSAGRDALTGPLKNLTHLYDFGPVKASSGPYITEGEAATSYLLPRFSGRSNGRACSTFSKGHPH